MAKRVLIAGITRQNGSYLAEVQLGKGHKFHGFEGQARLLYTQQVDGICRGPFEGAFVAPRTPLPRPALSMSPRHRRTELDRSQR